MLEQTRGAVLLSALLVGLAGCSHTISSKDVERKLGNYLSAQVGQMVKAMCPKRLEAKKGKTYRCTVVAADRSRTEIKLTMLDDSGKFRFRGARATGVDR